MLSGILTVIEALASLRALILVHYIVVINRLHLIGWLV